MDISADLTELARTPVIVVSSGDPNQFLNVRGVHCRSLEPTAFPTVAYQTDEFPAFFTIFWIPAPARMDNPDQVKSGLVGQRRT
jgi:pseudouridine-5'-phosphate glycosidase